MNTVPRDVTVEENHKDMAHGTEGQPEAALVELGAVSDTKGGIWGSKPDNGNGLQNL
jgi:hypothetical protein